MENTTDEFADDANFTNDDAINADHDKIANDLLDKVKKAAKKTVKAKTTSKAKITKKAKEEASEEKPKAKKAAAKKTATKKVKEEVVAEEEAEVKPKKTATKKKATKKVEVEEMSEEDEIAALEAKLAAIKAKKSKSAKNIADVVAKADAEETDEVTGPVSKKKTKEVVSEDEEEFQEDKAEKSDEDKTTFADLGLDGDILDALNKKGYEFPTPIQENVIPLLLEGGIDVIGQAQTGTGKTAAFGLPILQMIEEGRKQTQALILAPTRELAIQVANEISSFKGRKRLNVVTVYGGQPIMQQIKDLNKGADIVVGTPGRVIDLMKRGKLRTQDVEYFVLDEADEMLNMGFIDDIEWIMAECNEDRQMLLFSATMPNKIKKLAKKYMGDYELVAVKNKEVTTSNTEQIYYPVFPKDRFKVLERILLMEPDFYGIIFSNTKLTADDITRKLLKDGIKAEALHGDIAQNQRERILKRFKDRKCTVLVATDVAARGIDVNDLTHVINYGLPQDSEAYVHRIGRTGRAGKKGKAISLVSNQDMKQLVVIEGIAKTKIKKETLPDADSLITERKNEITTRILDTELSGDDEHFQDIADALIESGDLEGTIAKILKDAYGKRLNVAKFETIKQPKNLDGNSADETRLFVALGKNGGYNNKKIEEYFIEKAGITEDDFLDVYVLDDFSFITVPFKEGVIILDKFKKIRQNGREIVTKAKAKGGGGGGGRSGGGGGFRGNRSGGGGGGRDRNRGGNDRRSGGGDRRERSSGSDRGGYSRGGSDRSGSDRGGSSRGSFSNNYGPKKSGGKSFTSKRRRD